MIQTVYGLSRDNGDGSASMLWFRNKEKVDSILDDDSNEMYYANEGVPSVVLTFPHDLNLKACGFRFSDND